MIYKLKKEGIHLCLWIFPYIDENSKYFKEAEEKGFLVKNTKGVTSRFYSTATSTSKVGCFDFTNPHFIEWYKPKVRSVVSMGIGAVKTDFSEAVPEDAVYLMVLQEFMGHNKLTFLYAKTIYDIMAEVKIPLGELPMLWGRSGYAGSHTIPAAWAGDSSTHLNNHACILRGGLSASMSGIPFGDLIWGDSIIQIMKGMNVFLQMRSILEVVSLDFLIHLADVMGKHQENPGILEKKQKRFLRNLMI